MARKSVRWTWCVVLVLFALGNFPRDSWGEAGRLTVDGFVGGASGPDDDYYKFQLNAGGGFGFGYEIVDHIQVRSDVGYFIWGDSVTSCPSFCTRETRTLRLIPWFMGVRVLLPVSDRFKWFLEIGRESAIAQSHYKFSTIGCCSGSIKESGHISGIAPGIGFEYFGTEHLGIGLGARYHFLENFNPAGGGPGIGTSFLSGMIILSYRP